MRDGSFWPKEVQTSNKFTNIEVHLLSRGKSQPTDEWCGSGRCVTIYQKGGVDWSDARQFAAYVSALRAPPQAVFHLARAAGENSHDPNATAAQPVHVLKTIKDKNPDCLFVFTSTDYVYGGVQMRHEGGILLDDNNSLLTEDDAAPINPYGRSKLAFERELLDGEHKLRHAVVMRLSNVIGAGGGKFLDFLASSMR